MPLFKKSDKEAVGAGNTVFAIIAAVLALAALVTAAHANRKAESNSTSAASTQVTLSEFAITPSTINAPLNGKLLVTNNGSTTHNFTSTEPTSRRRIWQPGAAATLDLDGLKAGELHRVLQRRRVTASRECRRRSSSAAAATRRRRRRGMANMDFNAMTPEQLSAMNDQMDANMAKAVNIYTAQLKTGPNTKGVGNQPLKPQVLADGTKEFHLTAELADWEVDTGQDRARRGPSTERFPGRGSRSTSATRCASSSTTSCRCRPACTSTASRCRSHMDGVPDVTQQPIKPGQNVHATSSWPRARSSACTTRTTTRRCRCRTACSASSKSATPAAGQHRPGHPGSADGAERRRRDRSLAQRQVVPGDGAGDRARRRLGGDRLLQRGSRRSTRCTCTGCRSS